MNLTKDKELIKPHFYDLACSMEGTQKNSTHGRQKWPRGKILLQSKAQGENEMKSIKYQIKKTFSQ